MAPKRSQTQAASAAKKAKTETPFQAACASSLQLLDQSSLPDSAKVMFRAALPFCLTPAAAERHPFQDSVVSSLSKIFDVLKEQHDTALSAEQAQAKELGHEKASINSKIGGAEEQVVACRSARDEAQQSLKEVETVSAAAKKELEAVQQRKVELLASNAKEAESKDAREKLIAETWTILKEASMPGKQWREKNKLIDSLVKVLADIDVEESLRDGLPVALKSKPTDRGVVASQCVTMCEEALQASAKVLVEKVASHPATVEDLDKEFDAASASDKQLRDSASEKQNGLIEAENELLNAIEAQHSFTDTVASLDDEQKHLAKSIEDTMQQICEITENIEGFKMLVKEGSDAFKPGMDNSNADVAMENVVPDIQAQA